MTSLVPLWYIFCLCKCYCNSSLHTTLNTHLDIHNPLWYNVLRMDKETRERLRKIPKKPWRIQRWNAWYDSVMFMSMMGAETAEIAKKLHKSPNLINNVKNDRIYLERYEALISIRKDAYVDVMKEMNDKKQEVFDQRMHLMHNA